MLKSNCLINGMQAIAAAVAMIHTECLDMPE